MTDWRHMEEAKIDYAEGYRPPSRFARFVKRVAQVFYGRHGFESYHGTSYPTEVWSEWFQFQVRRFFSRLRIDICFDESDGFDVGAFVGDWKAARGPFLLHRQMEDFSNDEGEWVNYGPWRLMVALSPKAWDGFDDGACK